MMTLEELKQQDKAPTWLTEEGFQMLSNGYLQPEETPRDAYRRVSKVLSSTCNRPDIENIFFDIIWKNWVCLSTPMLANTGTHNLNISCYGQTMPDDTFGIMNTIREAVMATKFGGGIGTFAGNLRSKNSPISRGGTSDGIIPFLKMLETAVDGTKQGSSRRGSVAAYLPINHGDIEEFIDIRRPTGDLNRRCLTKTFHNAVTITDDIMQAIICGDKYYRNLWNRMLTNRVETGENYIIFSDNANKNTFEQYKHRIDTSQLCTEIFLPTSNEESFVCCLSSLNLAKYNEWKDWTCSFTNEGVVELAIRMLDAAMTLFIKDTNNEYKFPGMERMNEFSKNHRALGLGVLGWHTLLQQELIPFGSFKAMTLNAKIFKSIREKADKITLTLGKEYGECEETKGTGRRNTVTLAIAPTMSNSVLSGGVSQGIEPVTANLFVQKGAKGSFIKKNKNLEDLLKQIGLDTVETWEQINKDSGSVKNIKRLSQEEKAIFLTAREIDQFALVQQAAQRQQWIDQGQSLNLFFSLPRNKSEALAVMKYINEVHIEAWSLGIKSLYYLKTGSPLKGDKIIVNKEDSCASCEG